MASSRCCRREAEAEGRMRMHMHMHMHMHMQAVAEAKGLSWETQLETLKKNGQWHVEVY